MERIRSLAARAVRASLSHGGGLNGYHDGEAALEAARAFDPDVVLLDLGLPKMNGYEVARRIRDASDGRRVLLVALTGYQADPERLQHAGFDRHLIKPPDMDTLTKLLGTVASPER